MNTPNETALLQKINAAIKAGDVAELRRIWKSLASSLMEAGVIRSSMADVVAFYRHQYLTFADPAVRADPRAQFAGQVECVQKIFGHVRDALYQINLTGTKSWQIGHFGRREYVADYTIDAEKSEAVFAKAL